MDRIDTETLRLLLAVIGALVIAGVYVWGRYKQKLLDFIHQRGEFDELDMGGDYRPPETARCVPTGRGGGTERVDPSISLDQLEDDEDLSLEEKSTPKPAEPAAAEPPARTASLGAPFLIQISVVATNDDCFNGADLRDALEDLQLIYGDMGIYHRYDREYRVPLFSIASLVEPGTFPIKNMEKFRCPGVILFFQPPQVDDPLSVFDDLVNTCHELADRLSGTEWDEKRQPLTEEKIAQMRQRLREAY